MGQIPEIEITNSEESNLYLLEEETDLSRVVKMRIRTAAATNGLNHQLMVEPPYSKYENGAGEEDSNSDPVRLNSYTLSDFVRMY